MLFCGTILRKFFCHVAVLSLAYLSTTVASRVPSLLDAIAPKGAHVTQALLQSRLRGGSKHGKEDVLSSESEEEIELLDFEKSMWLRHAQSTSILVWFEGTPDADSLQARVREVVAHNKWLAARLRTRRRRLVSVHSARHQPECFHVLDMPHITPSMPYVELVDKLKHLLVKVGAESIDNDEPLYKVTLVRLGGARAALLSSLSHMIADGETANTIMSMLSQHSQVEALEAQRLPTFDSFLAGAIGQHEINFINRPAVLLGSASTLFLRKAAHVSVFDINAEWAEQEKARSRALGEPKISTNDVVTSTFFKESGCDFGIMAVNFRNRLPGCHSKLAGNYESGILYRSTDVSSPALIRKSLSSYRRCGPEPSPLPDTLTTIKWKGSLITNWSSLYREVSLAGCTTLFQLPLYLRSGMAFRNVMLLFRPNAHTTSALLFSRSIDLSSFAAHPLVGAPAYPVPPAPDASSAARVGGTA